MKHLNQWIVWREEPRAGDPKPAKVPFDPRTGRRADSQDPAQWMSHADAVATGHMIGFVFTVDDPYFFLDLDYCVGPEGCQPHAAALVQRFAGAEVELSHSGDGLHVFGRYSGPRPDHGVRCGAIGGELYTAGRFAAIGSGAQGDCDTDHTVALHVLAAQYFPPVARAGERADAADWTDGPCDGWTGPADDDVLITKARASGGLFSDSMFEALWTRDVDKLAEAYPDPSRDFDCSSADAALAKHLAFWTGNDCERIVRLMRRSELVRDKWDEARYLPLTVGFVVARTAKVYDYVAPEPAAGGEVRSGLQFLAVQEQLKLFAGCIYVISRNRVMMPSGQLLSMQQFNAVLPSYEFARDDTGTGSTRKPWEAFTESLSFQCPVADQVCFDPTAQWDKPLSYGGLTHANSYRPVETPRHAGDPTRFLDHLARLLPDDRDRSIILAYMAAVVQYKGVKFQWAPLLQGVEGNGKTLLTRVLMEAIGSRYAHTPQAHDLGSKFNAWLQGKILIGIEDIYVPSDKTEILEALKPMITGDVIGIRAMQSDEEMARICANFILNSNHRDAIRTTEGDRRFAVFFTAQQRKVHLARDGMGGDYFPELYRWLRIEGYAIVHDYLATYAIPDELNPATTCMRAPVTSSYDEFREANRSPVEQEVLDAIDEGRPGFRGGWISRTMFVSMLRADHRKLAISTQREILANLGYTRWGRTRAVVRPDERRAELWTLDGSLAASGNAAAYEKAQMTTGETSDETKQAR
jgi:hypothetical protein